MAVDTIITAGEDATVIAKDKEKTIKAKHLQYMFTEYRYLQYLLPHIITKLYIQKYQFNNQMHSVEYEDSFVKIAGLIGGEEYTKVARALLNSEDTTDEEIASATGLRINIIRKVLYDMFGKALITGIRVKDEKKGWFVYRWRAKQDQVDNFIENQKKKILDRLQKRLEYEESSEFYYCGNRDCPRVKFDYAVEVFFRCPLCRGSLNMVDNSKIKEALHYKIEQISADVSCSK